MFATYAAPCHRGNNSSVFYGGKEPIFTMSLRQNRARLASGIRLRCILLAQSDSRARGKPQNARAGKKERGSDASINLDRRRLFSQNFCCTFRGFQRTYVHTPRTFSRIRTLRPSMTFLSLAALFPVGAVEERTLFPERHAKSFNDFFQRQFLLSR